MQRHNVGGLQQRFQVSGHHKIRQALRYGIRIVHQDPHSQRLAAARHCTPDAAAADNSQRLALQAKDRPRFTKIPDAALHLRIGQRNFPRQTKHQRQRMVGYFLRTIIRDIADDDAAFGCRFQINRIDAHAVTDDNAALPQMRQHPARQRRILDKQRLRLGALYDHFILSAAMQPAHILADIRQRLPLRLNICVVAIGNDDGTIVTHTALLSMSRLKDPTVNAIRTAPVQPEPCSMRTLFPRSRP